MLFGAVIDFWFLRLQFSFQIYLSCYNSEMWLFFGEACSWVLQIKRLSLFYCIVQHFLKLLLVSNGNNTERISFVLTSATKQCKRDAEASRLKLLLFWVPQRWVQCKQGDTQFCVPLYSGPNVCSFGFLFNFYFLSPFLVPFPFSFSLCTYYFLMPCPQNFCFAVTYLLILQVFPPFTYLFLFATFFLITSLPFFWIICSISCAPAQFHLYL